MGYRSRVPPNLLPSRSIADHEISKRMLDYNLEFGRDSRHLNEMLGHSARRGLISAYIVNMLYANDPLLQSHMQAYMYCSFGVLYHIVAIGNLELLRWLYRIGRIKSDKNDAIAMGAMRYAHWDILRWIHCVHPVVDWATLSNMTHDYVSFRIVYQICEPSNEVLTDDYFRAQAIRYAFAGTENDKVLDCLAMLRPFTLRDILGHTYEKCSDVRGVRKVLSLIVDRDTKITQNQYDRLRGTILLQEVLDMGFTL